jgi:hypothetical protein
VLRHYIDDLAFAFVAPLRADDDGRLARFQLAAPFRSTAQSGNLRRATSGIRTQLATYLR